METQERRSLKLTTQQARDLHGPDPPTQAQERMERTGSQYAVLDNITEDPQQGSPEIIAILENDMLMGGLMVRNQEMIKEGNIIEDNAHDKGTEVDLQRMAMGCVDIPCEVDILTRLNNSEPMEKEAHEENLATRPPLSPRILNQAANMSPANTSKRTNMQA
ncbi:hypothetical protein Cgig2_011814 [Carnegiea gigantea]|uniref:Uncharacterized protein n=1 Tax=Carnegiea gigantea TaxID=171969 RepID=A0A9Q1JXE2_9CARY|nr:hypothetical protein Cgig2_011814 [Carnegiea gigantea]